MDFEKAPEWQKNLFAFAFGVLVFFVVFEVALHINAAIGAAPICAYRQDPDPRENYTFIPSFETRHTTSEFDNLIKTNSYGFRGPEPEKDMNTILIVGDSMTFGQGVDYEQTYPYLMDKELAAEGRNVQVLNAGVPGYGTIQETIFFTRLVPKLKPKIGVLAFPLGDIPRDLKDPPLIITNDHCIVLKKPVPTGFSLDSIKKWVYENVLTIRFFGEQIRRVPFFRDALMTAGVTGSGANALSVQFYMKNPNSLGLDAYAKEGDAIKQFISYSRANGIKPFVIVIPTVPQMLDKNDTETLKLYNIPPGLFDPYKNIEWADSFLKDQNVPYVVILEAFHASDKARLFYPKDTHGTSYWHQIMATEALKAMKEQGLLE